nr:hypothetical protein [Tanacetum cinerariifolium]
MLEEMVGISLDSMLDKWHRIIMGIMHGRMVGFKLLRMQFRMQVFRVVTQLLIAQKKEEGIQLQAEEFDFMAAVGDLDEIEEVNAIEPIHEPQLVPKNDNHVTSVALSMVQSGGKVETSSALNEETRAHQETVYRNLID